MQFLNKNNPKKISNNINPNEICITIWEIMKRIVDFFNVDVIIRVDFNRDENEIDLNMKINLLLFIIKFKIFQKIKKKLH